jgi:hypothetical protein
MPYHLFTNETRTPIKLPRDASWCRIFGPGPSDSNILSYKDSNGNKLDQAQKLDCKALILDDFEEYLLKFICFWKDYGFGRMSN